jgi:hypothetical protein
MSILLKFFTSITKKTDFYSAILKIIIVRNENHETKTRILLAIMSVLFRIYNGE